MPNALVPLASFTLTSAQASVVFTGIPQSGFKDLRIVISAKNTASAQGLRAQFNDDTGSNYTHVVMYGTGASAISAASGALTYADLGVNRTTDTAAGVDIMDYNATNKHKTVLVRSSNASELVLAYANRWASTNAITKIMISASADSLTAGSTFNLYGVL